MSAVRRSPGSDEHADLRAVDLALADVLRRQEFGRHRGFLSKEVPPAALVAMALSVIGISAGTLAQRARGTTVPLLWGTVVQYIAAALLFGVAAATEGFELRLTGRLIFGFAWAIVVLSIAAVLVMLWMLNHHAAARVSSLFFLTPALSTVEGALLFGERLGALALVGLSVALAGVALTMRPSGVQPV